MTFNKKYILNLGLAFTLLYAGVNILLYPLEWIGFVPAWITNFYVTREFALASHAIVEIILGLWLLSNYKIKWAATIVALDMASIILLNGLGALPITFRDIGLLFMATYLAVDGQ